MMGKVIKLVIIVIKLVLLNYIRVRGIIIMVSVICSLNKDIYYGVCCSF